MSAMFEQIKKWYIDGLWTKKRVLDAYKVGKITKDECDTILNIKD